MKIYIDPSITCAGVAFFRNGQFFGGRLIVPKEKGYTRLLEMTWGANWKTPEVVYFEEPLLRMRGRGPAAKPADLIKLAASAGALVAQVSGMCPVGSVQPQQWKGSIPKEVTHRHMWTALSTKEAAALRATEGRPSLIHNLYDAVCIGLYLEGRAPWKKLDKKHLAVK